MPWKECHVMDERLRFVARRLEGEKMAALVRRVRDLAQDRLQDFRPVQGLRAEGVHGSQPTAVSPGQSVAAADRGHDRAAEAGVSRLGRAEDPREAAPADDAGPHLPAISTVHAVLDRHGLVKRRRRRHHSTAATFLSRPTEPNALWCADYKGEFRARQSAVLLSADHHGLCQSVSPRLRRARDDAGDLRVYRLRARLQRVWAPARHSDR